MGITIYGASDDLIEIDGDVYEEFEYNDDRESSGDLIALSNGAIFRVKFTDDGIWRVTPIVVPEGVVWEKQEAHYGDEGHSDRVTVQGVAWVVHGDVYAQVRLTGGDDHGENE